VGGSWLYHLEAYRRLFPPGFLASAQAEEPDARFLALWGQFLDHQGQVKPDMAQRFERAVDRAGSLAELMACFPYPVLRLERPLEEFYAFFGTQR